MFGIDQQIARLETLTCEMSRKLDTMINLLEQLVDAQAPETYTVTIDEALIEAWQGQNDRLD
jgi:hypothetical protein